MNTFGRSFLIVICLALLVASMVSAAAPILLVNIVSPTEASPVTVRGGDAFDLIFDYSALPAARDTARVDVIIRRMVDDSAVVQMESAVEDCAECTGKLSVTVPEMDEAARPVEGWLSVSLTISSEDGRGPTDTEIYAIFARTDDDKPPAPPGTPDITTAKPTNLLRPTWTWLPGEDPSGPVVYRLRLGTTPGGGDVLGGYPGTICASNTWMQSVDFPDTGVYYLTVWSVDIYGWRSEEVTSAGVRYQAAFYVDCHAPVGVNDGTSWENAFLTVQEGLNAATSGWDVWVADGTYAERITLKTGVGLYGGFAGTETSRSQRNPAANPTILDGGGLGSVVTSPDGAGNDTIINGFTIRNGLGTTYPNPNYRIGGGVLCRNSAPTVSGNTITGNNCSSNYGSYGGGIYCENSSAVIVGNSITGNICQAGQGEGRGPGVYIKSCAGVTLTDNTISSNTGTGQYGGGVSFLSSSGTVARNTITGNSVTYGGGGIYCTDSAVSIMHNVVSGNSAGGIFCASSPSASIVNNMVVANTSSMVAGGIYCDRSISIIDNTVASNTNEGIAMLGCSPTLVNNIVAYNAIGVLSVSGGTPVLSYNCVFGNTSSNYSGVSAGANDIAADPLFADRPGGNYHLSAGSPCINAGDNLVAGLPSTDIDGGARVRNDIVDIGADEGQAAAAEPTFSPNGGFSMVPHQVTVSSATPNSVIHYTTDGSDPDSGDPSVLTGGSVLVDHDLTLKAIACRADWLQSPVSSADYEITRPIRVKYDAAGPSHDGDSWETAFLTVQEAIDVSDLGDEVWVAAGTYSGTVTVTDGTLLYGGFVGNETDLSQRNWAHNPTILDGGGVARVVSIPAGVNPITRIDGFTITHGSANQGAGIYCPNSPVTIANNFLTANAGSGTGPLGGAIFCGSGTPTIVNNLITGNTAGRGAAIYCGTAYPKIFNNTIADNTAYVTQGAGIHFAQAAGVAKIWNNIVAFNTSGIHHDPWISIIQPEMRHNTSAQNRDFNFDHITPGVGDNMSDPLFVDRSTGEYRLSADSPCRDTGNNAVPVLLSQDFVCRNRVNNATVDRGALEWYQPVSIPILTPAGGLYDGAQSIVVECATTGATIHYTMNGLTPTTSDPGVASGDSLTVDHSLTLKARAFHPDTDPSDVASEDYRIDLAAPSGSISINGGAELATSTDAALTLSATDDLGVITGMQFSNDNSTWTAWEPFTASKSWTLDATAGLKTVYVRFKDEIGKTASASDDITLDLDPPEGSVEIDGGAEFATSVGVTLTLSATDDTGVISGMQFSNDETTWTGWEAYAVTKAWTLDDAAGLKTVYVRFKDQVAQVTTVSDAITLDLDPPEGSVEIDGGAEFATSVDVNLTLSATDDTGVISGMQFSNDETTWSGSEPYAVTKAWALDAGVGLKTVYARFSDQVGRTVTVSDGITLDLDPPEGSILINGGDDLTFSPDVTLTLSATDDTGVIPGMQFSNDGTTWTAWEPYSDSKAWSLDAVFGLKTVYAEFKDQTGKVTSVSDSISLEDGPPNVEETDPPNGDTHVPVNSVLTIRFDEPVFQGAAFDSIELRDAESNLVPAAKALVTDTISVAPSGYLETSSEYILVVPAAAIEDADGNSLSAEFVLDFTTADWRMEVVASAGNVGQHCALALDNEGRPRIAYQDATNRRLRYASKDGSGWHFETVDSTTDAMGDYLYCSLAIDTLGDPHVSYHHSYTLDTSLKYACKPANLWQKQTLDTSGSFGRTGLYSSIAIDEAGYPVIAHQKETFVMYPTPSMDTDLRTARKNPSGWQMEIPDPEGQVGKYPSVALDSADFPHVSYYDQTNTSLAYVYKDGVGWHKQTVDNAADVGAYTSLAMDSSDRPHIGYYNATNGHLKYAYKDGFLWQIETVDSDGNVGWYTSIALDDAGNPHIAYYDVSHYDLKYACKIGGVWHIESLDRVGDVGAYASIELNSAGQPRIAYREATSADLKYIYRILPDSEPPTGSVSIEDGAVYTESDSVTLNLLAWDETGYVTEMRISDDGTTWTAWEQYAATRAWILAPGSGLRIVWAQFRDSAGNVSAAVSDSIVIGAPMPIGDGKELSQGDQVIITGKIVTAKFPECIYVEEPDRSSGVKILGDPGVLVGDRVDVAGTVDLTDCEMAIVPQICEVVGTGSVAPIGMPTRSLGGGPLGVQIGTVGSAGLNNIGLLIRAWGQVTYSEAGYYYVNDGSGAADESGHSGVKVLGDIPLPQGTDPIGKHVQVTGISSCFGSAPFSYRMIRAMNIVVFD